ncbi:MAG: Uma2 family endonuclease [Chloroflexota bacterium]|nr:Uma2 family endonuclease [Chloroflexota bacterium]
MTATASPPTATTPRRLFTVHEFHKMAKAGILGEKERVELIEGEIIQMSPIGGSHVLEIARLVHLLVPLVEQEGLISPQGSLRISERTELLPDFVVLRNKQYDGVPVAADALLVIEVSDSSLSRDLSSKVAIYAAAGVQEYWVWDVKRHVVHQFTDPSEGQYQQRREVKLGETITSVALPAISFKVVDISR